MQTTMLVCAKRTFRRLTGDGFQMLQQSRREASSRSTDDELDIVVDQYAIVGPTKTYGAMNCRDVRHGREDEERTWGCTLFSARIVVLTAAYTPYSDVHVVR